MSEIRRANEGFDQFAAAHGIPAKVRLSINVAFDELLNNIISYAYRNDREQKIEVSVEVVGKRLVVTIVDQGERFNPLDRPAPDTTLSLAHRREGGLGIHLVRNMMDEVSYERRADKNVITLIKGFAAEEG
jgi:anti-sigma regulatory factor (Ser/Thr protein kinase)